MVIKRSTKWIDTAEELYRIEQHLKELSVAHKSLKDTLKQLSNNEDARGGKFMFFREYRKGNIDYRSIPAIKSLDLEPYRNQDVEIWKLKSL